MSTPSFDELNADQLKELIQSGSGKVDRRKKKRTKKLPLQDERRKADDEKYKVNL